MQNRSQTKNVTSKLKNDSLEAVNQRSQLMFVLCWYFLQQFFAPSHQLGPRYHRALVDHTLWWTKIITICISMLQSRKNSCSLRKKATPHRQFIVSKRLTPNFVKIDRKVHYIKLTHMVTSDTIIPQHIEDGAFKFFKCTLPGFNSEWGQVSINIRQQDHSETGPMYCIINL